MKKKPEYIASIDLGSNALRCLIVKKNPKGLVAQVTYRQQLDLGEDVFYHHRICSEKKYHTLKTFKAIKEILNHYQVSKVKAVTTAAMRSAKNSALLQKEILKHTDIQLEIISGEQEALYVQRAIESHLRLKRSPTLLMDLGGGSIEFTLIKNKKILEIKSFPLGTIHLKKASSEEFLTLLSPIREELRSWHEKYGLKNFIGTGGNLRRISKISPKSPSKKSYFMKSEAIKRYHRLYEKKTLEQIRSTLDLSPKKAQALTPALRLVDLLMSDLKFNRICLPPEGLKEGVILDVTGHKKIKMKGMKKVELNLTQE